MRPSSPFATILPTLLVGLALTTIAMGQLKPPDPNRLNERQRQRASELFAQLKATPDDHAKRTEIVQEMTEVGRGVALKMFSVLDREWGPKWTVYKKVFAAAAKKAASTKSTGEAKQEIARLQETVQSLRKKGDLSKEHVIEIGDPALKRLRELKILTIAEILAADSALERMRDEILAIADQRDFCIEALVLDEDEAQPFGSDDLKAYETVMAGVALGPPSSDQAVLAANEKLKGKVPDAEIDAVRDMNLYRTLIGLRACAIDPKLCDASRGHSKDMAEKGFFAHDSPVPGKETPWKRAAQAGTKASSENIAAGYGSGKGANKGWWYSPGHHKNMLSPSPRRVGMGVHGNHWTQMFGG